MVPIINLVPGPKLIHHRGENSNVVIEQMTFMVGSMYICTYVLTSYNTFISYLVVCTYIEIHTYVHSYSPHTIPLLRGWTRWN